MRVSVKNECSGLSMMQAKEKAGHMKLRKYQHRLVDQGRRSGPGCLHRRHPQRPDHHRRCGSNYVEEKNPLMKSMRPTKLRMQSYFLASLSLGI